MTALTADEYGALFTMDLHAHDLTAARTEQTNSGQVGISDLGRCQEHTRRVIIQSPHTDSPSSLAAQIGNAVHTMAEAARLEANPGLRWSVPVKLKLPNGAIVPGTVDELDVDEPSVNDLKTKDGLATTRREGSTRQQRWQRHGYYAALWQEGVLPEQGIVRNVYVDRSGQDERVHVEQEPFDPNVLHEMAEWLDEVLEAVRNNHEAAKEKPRTWCRSYCPFFTACRGSEVYEKDFRGTDLEAVVDAYGQAKDDKSEGEQRMKELRPLVEGETGITGRYRLTSTWKNRGANGSWTVEVKAL